MRKIIGKHLLTVIHNEYIITNKTNNKMKNAFFFFLSVITWVIHSFDFTQRLVKYIKHVVNAQEEWFDSLGNQMKVKILYRLLHRQDKQRPAQTFFLDSQ